MAKYVIELDDEQLQLIKEICSTPITDCDESNSVINALRTVQPLAMLDLQQEMQSYKYKGSVANRLIREATQREMAKHGFDPAPLQMKLRTYVIPQEVVKLLELNDWKFWPHMDCYRVQLGTASGTAALSASRIFIQSEPEKCFKYVKEKYALFNVPLRLTAFFQNWDDEEDKVVVTKVPNAWHVPDDLWGDYWGSGTAATPNKGVTTASCAHKWKMYTGLMEKFEYCTECNVKKGDNK